MRRCRLAPEIKPLGMHTSANCSWARACSWMNPAAVAAICAWSKQRMAARPSPPSLAITPSINSSLLRKVSGLKVDQRAKHSRSSASVASFSLSVPGASGLPRVRPRNSW
ncbi:hypothetical protein D9M71_597890 [compost metagenome]